VNKETEVVRPEGREDKEPTEAELEAFIGETEDIPEPTNWSRKAYLEAVKLDIERLRVQFREQLTMCRFAHDAESGERIKAELKKLFKKHQWVTNELGLL